MKVEVSKTINGDVVQEIGKIHELTVYRNLNDRDDAVLYLVFKDGTVLNKKIHIDADYHQGAGYVDQIKLKGI